MYMISYLSQFIRKHDQAYIIIYYTKNVKFKEYIHYERAQFNSHLKIGHLTRSMKISLNLVVHIRKFLVISPCIFLCLKVL